MYIQQMKKNLHITTILVAVFASFNSFAQSPFGSVAKSATFADQTITSGQKTNFKLGEALVMAYEDITIDKIAVSFAGEPSFIALVSNFRIVINETQEGATFTDVKQRRSIATNHVVTDGTIKRISLLGDLDRPLDSITVASFLKAAIIISYHSNASSTAASDSTTLQKTYWRSQTPAEVRKVTVKDLSITLYPNPTSDFLHISNVPQNGIVTILDVTGKIFYSGNEENIDVQSLQNGVYVIEVRTDYGKQTMRFMKI